MSSTKICALFGYPLKHSISDYVYNQLFKSLKMNYVFLVLETKNLKFAINSVKNFGFRGVSITKPYKIEVLRYVDWIDNIANKIGAVNTIVNDRGYLRGYNTDCIGAMNALKSKMKLKNKKVVLLGSGGAARAIAFGLKEEKCETTILNRNSEKAKNLANKLGFYYGGLSLLSKASADVLINATSVGMLPSINESIVDKKSLQRYQTVFDIVYNPFDTKLLREARKAGCNTIRGIDMFIGQAKFAFELWTKKRLPKNSIEKIAYSFFSRDN